MIEIKGLSFAYGHGERAVGLHEINLTIGRGEFVLLCGGSGCGKTTLTRLINGLIPHYYEGDLCGSVLVNELDVSVAPLYETAGVVGSVFQNPRSQFFNVDTTSELAFGCENMGMAEADIRESVERVVQELNLKPLLGRNIFALSGGEKQKIACGSAAALQPQVFVLDEPSSNLDNAAVEELRQLLMQWKKQGKTIIIAEHRLHYVHDLADRVLFMEDGRIKRVFAGAEFSALSHAELDAMGLRVLRVECLRDASPPCVASCGKHLTMSGLLFAYPRCDQAFCVDCAKVPAGEVIAVIGHNGAGKSTFARCLCGLEKTCAGTTQLGCQMLSVKARLKTCYMVMQDVNHQLFTESVLDEVLLSMEKPDESRAEEILAGLNLLQFKGAHPMSLSGGQKQRVAIASAIASGREIVVLDEPTSGLDLRHMREVVSNLRGLAQMGKSVFVITHDIELILAACTHVIEFKAGRIVRNEALCAAGSSRTLDWFLSPRWSDDDPQERAG